MTTRAQLDLDLRARVEQTGTVDGTGTPEADRRPGYTVTILDAADLIAAGEPAQHVDRLDRRLRADMTYPDSLDVRPLQQWPGALTTSRQESPFTATLTVTLALLTRELRALDAVHPVLEVAIPADQWRLDGRPRSQARATHPGVVLTLPKTKVGGLRYPCDQFWTWQGNLRAIALALEALRKVDRYGVTKRGEQYAGWKALLAGDGATAAGTQTSEQARLVLLHWYGAPLGTTVLVSDRDLWRGARGIAHPDRNSGDQSGWDTVEAAARTLGLTS